MGLDYSDRHVITGLLAEVLRLGSSSVPIYAQRICLAVLTCFNRCYFVGVGIFFAGKGITGKRLKELMETDMRGEMTVSPNKVQGRDAVDERAHTELARELA